MPARSSAQKAAGTARDSADKAKEAADKATKAAGKATKAAKATARKAAGTTRARRAARSGLVEDAKQIAAEADLGDGATAEAIAEAEQLHYQVEVNKRGFSASYLTKTLNERWDNGWRLLHILEQRGNTVLVFEKRS